MKKFSVCSVCGEKLHISIERDEKTTTVYCHSCYSKSKNGKKITNQVKYLYSDKNLEIWK